MAKAITFHGVLGFYKLLKSPITWHTHINSLSSSNYSKRKIIKPSLRF